MNSVFGLVFILRFRVGTICGLALYNFIIINLPFPLALYKKLLKEKVDIGDLKELSPVLGRTLQNVLDYADDDIEDVFDLTFEISRENYGQIETVQLKPDGDKIRVNQSNKYFASIQCPYFNSFICRTDLIGVICVCVCDILFFHCRAEFVELYIDFVLNKSVETQFDGFYAGFMKVCGGQVMELFRAHELMALVIGNEDYDWDAFEQSAKYKGGYTSGDPTVNARNILCINSFGKYCTFNLHIGKYNRRFVYQLVLCLQRFSFSLPSNRSFCRYAYFGKCFTSCHLKIRKNFCYF